MKITWGTGIAIFYVCFMAAMIFMVIKSSQNKMDLVQENYYQKDLVYEQFRSKRQAAANLDKAVQVAYRLDNNSLELIFPKEIQKPSGTLTLFRPSNKFLDQSFELPAIQDSKMTIPLDSKIAKGLWRIQIDWEMEGQQFYTEQSIVI